jgi:hypothetical protein
MILKYGTYAHDNNECALTSITKSVNLSETGERLGYTERWRIRGVKHADTQAALTTALAALETAYAYNGRDLVLYYDDGSTVSQHALYTGTSRSGVRITEFSYPAGEGAEYSTFRTFEIGAEAEYLTSTAGILSWVETITLLGGGEVWALIPTLRGPAQRQVLQQQGTYGAIQSGQSIGYNGWLVPATPIWPQYEHRERRRIERTTPTFLGNGEARYPISWNYEFEAAVPIFGSPTLI